MGLEGLKTNSLKNYSKKEMMEKMIERLTTSFPSLLTAMIASATFTMWANNHFQTVESARVEKAEIVKTLDEYKSDIKEIKEDLSFIKGQLSKK